MGRSNDMGRCSGGGGAVYVRGLKEAGAPPDDGYVYDRVADTNKRAYVWVPRMTAAIPLEEREENDEQG